MSATDPILILRDPRESIRKCSLTPLRGRPDVVFREYRPERRTAAEGRVLLHPDGEEIGPADEGAGLLLLDSSWRRLPALLASVDGPFELRRLPPLKTAYPRKSRTFADPSAGLASIEALYAALFLLGRPLPELLEAYRWRDDFLERNPIVRPAGFVGPER